MKHWFFLPCHRRSLRADHSGATIVLVAIMLPILVSVMAITIDMARLYVVQSKAQTALDNALLGAVASETRNNRIRREAIRLFRANYPRRYMGSRAYRFRVSNQGNGVYEGTVRVRVPTTILRIARNRTIFDLRAEVTRGFQRSSQNLELALVIDNSSEMRGAKAGAVRTEAIGLIDNIYDGETTLPNVSVSVVPYNMSVNIGTGRFTWIQNDLANQFIYFLYNLFGFGFVSNRNADSPPNAFNDINSAAPLINSARFRVPQGRRTFTSGVDTQFAPLPEIRFAMNNRNQILSAINNSFASGDLRINVGLMWGWFTLSPNWQGVWSGGLPTSPASFSSNVTKSLVLVTGGKNNVFLGVTGTNPTSNDNTTLQQLCSAIKGQGINLFVIGYAASNNDLDENLLSNCASPGSYYRARNANDVTTAFEAVFESTNAETVRLTE